MNARPRQSGQLLFAAIVLVVLIAALVSVLAYLNAGSLGSSAAHDVSDQAYAAARSGAEYAAGQYFNSNTCSSLNGGNAAVGNGTFTLATTLYQSLTPTTTSAALTASSTSVPVASTTGYAPYGRILIDSELINYSSITATGFNGLSRGVDGTTAAAHASGVPVSQNVCLIQSTGTVGTANRIVEAALGAGNTAAPGALGTMGPDAMVVYAKGTALTGGGSDRNVYYRLWDGNANNWGAEQTAQQVSANSSPVFIAIQFARTRNEALMGVLDGNGQFWLQVWNGLSWATLNGGAAIQTGLSTAGRGFQIAYEYNSDQALIVYTNNTRNPLYRTWDGTTLSASATVNGSLGLGSYPTSGVPRWFRLAPRNVVGSDDILMISLDSGRQDYGARWTGSGWDSMGTPSAWDTTVTDANVREAIDIAWQSNGSLAVFVEGDATTRQIGYRTWNATTSTLTPTGNGSANSTIRLTFPGSCASQVFEWFRLYPDPNNNILAMMQTANRCLLSTVWSGGAFGGTATGHEGTNGVESAASRTFDFAWEKQPSASGSGWLLWGSSVSAGISTKRFTSPLTWGAAATIGDHTLLVQAGSMSPSGTFVTGTYESTAAAAPRDTESSTTTGNAPNWPNAATQLWAGPTTIQQGERVYVMTRENARINTGATGTGAVSILQTQEVLP